MGNAWTIQARNASNVPRHTRCNASTSVNAVKILARSRKHDANRGDARRGELEAVHLNQNVEPVESRHARNVDPKVDMRTFDNSSMAGRGHKDRWCIGGIRWGKGRWGMSKHDDQHGNKDTLCKARLRRHTSFTPVEHIGVKPL